MSLKKCPLHGLHFDPDAHDGCVLCRRAADSSPRASSNAGIRIVALLILGAIAITAMSLWVRRKNEEAAANPTVKVVYDPTTAPAPPPASAPAIELVPLAPPILRTPTGTAPATGWPLMVLLHGTGGAGDRFVEFAEAANAAHFAAVLVTGPVGIQPGKYGWPDDVDAVGRYVAKMTETATTSSPSLNRKRVVIGGYSTGAWLAIRLAAARPDVYSAVLAFSPLGPTRSFESVAAASPVELRMFVGRDDEGVRSTAAGIESVWRARGWPVHVIAYDGGHQPPGSYREMFTENARAIADRAQ